MLQGGAWVVQGVHKDLNTGFLTLWVLLVHDCVLQVHALHKFCFREPFGSIMWGQYGESPCISL